MKKIYFLPIAMLMFTSACNEKSGGNQPTDKGLNIANMDTTMAPGTDFYRYATGGWSDANPIPDEYGRYGAFEKLYENNQDQIRELIETLSSQENEAGSVAQKIGDLYKQGMDSVKLNTDKAEPIAKQLAEIDSASSVSDIVKLAARLRYYASAPFFGLYIGADDTNSSMNIAHIYQAGLGLGEKDYYLANDEKSKDLRDGYARLIVTQFLNAGYNQEKAEKAAKIVLRMETELAKSHFEKEKTRIPELNYHKLPVSQLNDSVARFDWPLFFNTVGAKGIKELNVAQVEPVAAAAKLIMSTPVEDSKVYLSWCLINSAANYLSDDFVNANFDFYGKQLSGRKVLQPRWKRTVSTINGSLGEEVGQMYVQKYFPPQAKQRMLDLVKNLEVSLGERINKLGWMSKETKGKAHEKLSSFIVKIGYPDKWRDCSELKIKPEDHYWANIVRSMEFEFNDMMNKLGKTVDKSEWLMSPQTVNAYYNPTTNEICFPAGILQPPFFYMDADDALNYGAIGVVIGHEMTHGFDDQGRKYDKNGNMTDWWTEDDAKRFEERAQVLIDFFDNIVVIDTIHANGTFTLGENIADHGGLQVSYNAFLKTAQAKDNEAIDGLTPQQRFFLSYANLWAGNIRDEEILRLTKLDPHSLGRWRVNGALPHINAWYEAFGITENDSLYVPVDKRASIW
ncbi:M13 family peptidase [Dysgonomonas sp. 216]|uniref:M13 family metallopeptidase n=1 Tax=Dysgonomonas sp. 216 TaxID=2302934 RepID=UPI0013D0E4F2|nr:M13 family metallopeptidase [Dysgonomonas sp. 216]NDW18002.1 M13 family peptidase [Dysgonomonas sp. 216]